MNKLKQNIKSGLIQGLTILFILGLGGVSYAAFTTFTDLGVTSGDSLTADKWNNLVDAVKNDYLTDGTEIITNKIWDGKPVYRSMRSIIGAGNINHNVTWISVAHNISNIDRIVNYDAQFYYSNGTLYDSDGTFKEGNSYDRRSYINKTNFYYINHDASISEIYVIIEYTKTTD